MGTTCFHDWGAEVHSHLGHERLGAHTPWRVCRLCRWAMHDSGALVPPDIQEFTTFLPNPHHCYAGWRGQLVLDVEFGAATPLPGRPGCAIACPTGCPCCHAVQTQNARLCPACNAPLHRRFRSPCNGIEDKKEAVLRSAALWKEAYGVLPLKEAK